MKYLFFTVLVVVLHLASAAYNPKMALEMGYMCAVAYNPVSQIASWTCPECKSPSHNAVIAAFRGTVDVKNWIANLDGTQVGYSKCSGCAVHKGFYSGYSEVSATVKAQVQFVLSKYRTAAIYVTGHSLGGALATLAALDIKTTFGRLDVFYSYGEPRVGNAAFASYFANQVPVFRLIHYADIVPHVPPLNMAYTHGGTQIWYTEDMQKYQVCAAEDLKCADSLPTHDFSTNDHSLSLYLKLPVSLIQMLGLRRGANF